MRLSTMAASCALFCALAVFASIVDAANPDPRTLVIVDDPLIRSTHSQLFDSLKARRHKLSFVHPEDKPVLVQYGKFNYENLVVINSASDDVGVTTEDLMDFVDSGRNVLVLTNANVSEAVREFANECGVDFDDSGSSVIDHFQFDTNLDNGLHTVIAADKVSKNSAFLGKGPSAPVLFSGVGQAINKNSPYVSVILTGSKTTFSNSPLSRAGADVQGTGVDTVLLSAVQMANNARVVFSGSVELFSNAYLSSAVTTQTAKYDRSGNEELVNELVKWNLGERAVLRAINLSHVSVRKPSEKNPFTYRIGDLTEFSIDIQEFDGVKGDWVAFTKSDVQLELVMMDPYHRSALKHNGRGLYTAKFQVPDNPGVFKFLINYRKAGYSNLQVEEQIAVRPYRHDEFERFLPAAYPYYMSAFSMMAGFFIFSLYFLYGKEK